MSRRRKNPQNRLIKIFIIAAVALALYFLPDFFPSPENSGAGPGSSKELLRDVTKLEYSKHARCRMACRNIDEKEVEQILLEGRINYAKSQQTGADPRYAIEGRTSDNQQVRIVYAATNSSIVVVTAIDLEMDWPCNCKD